LRVEGPSEGEPSAQLLLDRLRVGAAELGLVLSDGQLGQYREYLDLLLEWNQRFNLTAIESPEAVIDKHFLDSLSCVAAVDFSRVHRVVDVGTGAGFPGLVIRIAFPHLGLLLLDAIEKRLRFLRRVIEALGLSGVETVHARAEDAGRDRRWREQFDVAVSRAVARLDTLSEFCLPLVRVGGSFLAQKGPDVAAEVDAARTAIRKLGGGPPEIRLLTLPGTEIGRSLVLVPKVSATPGQYPRLPGTPKKHPL
jgi:16S rRNA (guanine527-N7)-methyltransferase